MSYHRAVPRVLSIFVRAGLDQYGDAEARLSELFDRQLPGLERDVLVVDNLLPAGATESRPGRIVIGGDNRVWEFSAIDAAVAHLGPSIWRYDLVNVVTSAFMQLYVAYLERFTPDVVSALAGHRACLGHIDCYNEPIRIGPYRSQHWIRTCFFMTPVAELMAIGSFVSASGRRPWFSGNPDDPFGPESPVCDTYKQYLTGWLLGQDIGQGVTWHRSLSAEVHGLEPFEQKALAILNEHLLAIRFRAAGCGLIDVTWLSAMLGAGRDVDWTTPWWQQLAERDRDALIIPAGHAA